MPKWTGKWKGGRFYTDELNRPVFFIERRRYSVKLKTHDETTAISQLASFLDDPEAFVRPPPEPESFEPVYITKDRVTLYMEHIHKACEDHRDAKLSQIHDWAELNLDLRAVNLDRKALRTALATFKGGHRGRVETLNAFCRFLVKEGDLKQWNPLVNSRGSDPKHARADRQAYSLEELRAAYARLNLQPLKDLFRVRVATGMHHTEIEQLYKCKTFTGPLPDSGAGIRTLEGEHEIRGVLQVRQKSKRRHRSSVDAETLAAALRLRDGVPDRMEAWEAFDPLIPSNLRHTYTTLAGEVGELVTWAGAGVDRARIAQTLGHRAGSTMLADRYDKLQVPLMIRLPLGF